MGIIHSFDLFRSRWIVRVPFLNDSGYFVVHRLGLREPNCESKDLELQISALDGGHQMNFGML